MTYSKVSVLVPTRGRVSRLQTLLSSFDQTVQGSPTAEFVFRIDDDDAETFDFLEGQRIVIGPRLQGYRSMPTFFNELAIAATGDVLMLGNDDMIFRTVGWSRILLDVANRFPDGLFDLGVSTLNEAHFPFATVSRQVIEVLGFIWDPRIFWGDLFLRDAMCAFGRCVMVPEVQIEHDWAGFAPDKIFLESTRDVTTLDSEYWTKTHPTAVSEAVKKLEKLQWSACVSQS